MNSKLTKLDLRHNLKYTKRFWIVKCIFNTSESSFWCYSLFKSSIYITTRATRSYPFILQSLQSFSTLPNQTWQHKLQNVSHLTDSNLQLLARRHKNRAWKLGEKTLSWAHSVWCETTSKKASRKGNRQLR